MSEYLSKKAVLEWLDYDPNGDGNDCPGGRCEF